MFRNVQLIACRLRVHSVVGVYSKRLSQKMHISAKDFEERLPTVLEAIQRSDIIAIDAEFTGLAAAPWLKASWLDSLDSKWCRIRDSALKMALLQYGLTTFEWTGEGWEAKPFVFMVLPRKSYQGGDDGTAGCGGDSYFVSSTDTVKFLRDNKFDFGAWSREGITFLSREHEAKLRDIRRREVLAKFVSQIEPEGETQAVPAGTSTGAGAGAQAAQPRQYRPKKITIKPMESVNSKPAKVETGSSSAAGVDGAAPSTAAQAPPLAADTKAAEQQERKPYNEWQLRYPDEIKKYTDMVKPLEAWIVKVKAWSSAVTAMGNQASPVDIKRLADEHGLQVETLRDAATGKELHFPFMLTDPLDGKNRRVMHTHLEWEYGPKGKDYAATGVWTETPAEPKEGVADTGADGSDGAQGFWVYGAQTSVQILAGTRSVDQGQSGNDWTKRMRLTWVGEGAAGKEDYLRADLRRSVDDVDQAISRAIGLRKVMDAVTTRKVPVVGHNCWLDLAHSTVKFLGPSMDRNVCTWATQLQHLFPLVYDTKYLITPGNDPVVNQAFQSRNSLEKAFTVVENADDRITAGVPAPPPPPPAEGAAPAPQEARRGGRGGGAGRDEMKKVEVPINWVAYAPVKLSEGHSYKTTTDGKVGLAEDMPLVAPPSSSPAATAGGADASGSTPTVLMSSVTLGKEEAPASTMVVDTPAAAPAPSKETGVAHDAGYDSFMTGVVFLRVAGRLLSVTAAQHAAQQEQRTTGALQDSAGLDRHRQAMAAVEAKPLSPSILHEVLQGVVHAPAPTSLTGPKDRAGIYNHTTQGSGDEEMDTGNGIDMRLLTQSARAVGNILHNMQSFHESGAIVNLDHMRALAKDGRAEDTQPREGEPGGPGSEMNTAVQGSLLLARKRARDKACWVYISGLDFSIRTSDLLALIAEAIGLRKYALQHGILEICSQLSPRILPAGPFIVLKPSYSFSPLPPVAGPDSPALDAKKVAWVDDSSAFVKLATSQHVDELLNAWASGPVYPESDDDSEEVHTATTGAGEGTKATPEAPAASPKLGIFSTVINAATSIFSGSMSGGDNLLGIPGHEGAGTVHSSSQAPSRKNKQARERTGMTPQGKRARLETDVSVHALQGMYASPFGAQPIGHLPASEITPDLALLLGTAQRHISQFKVMTYKEWLEQPHVAEVFGNVCDHECVPDAPHSLAALPTNTDSANAVNGVVTAQPARENNQQTKGPGSAPGCLMI